METTQLTPEAPVQPETPERRSAAPRFQLPKKRRKWLKRLVLILAAAGILFLLLRPLLFGSPAASSGQYQPAAVQRQDLTVSVDGSGTMTPIESYQVGALVSGEILSDTFEKGDQVEEGQLLYTIDSSNAASSQTQAQNSYSQAQTSYEQAVKAKYPPGSTFKLVQGLIGLQEGVLRPSDLHSCHMGYQAGRLKMACHAHASPLDLRFAVATSCNAYFCYVFRDILDNPKYGSVKEGYDVWKQYVESFGFGRKLGSDFLDEGNGYVPDRAYYDRQYRGSWNSLTVLSLSIGQDALGCTPLQLANLACIVANRGYYYIPHIVKKIEGQDSLDARFYERHYTMVEPKHFEPIVEGMWRGVNVGGTSTRARLEGLDVCGKTGTAENPRGRDHSTFLSFAPKDNPKIAISVYVENGGFGASAALPIASLLEEYYLTDTIRRPELLQYIKDMNIYYPAYDK